MTVLVGHDIHKTFRRETGELVKALDGVSLTMGPSTAVGTPAQRGSLTALVGPDGAGKTTLIRLAAGLMRADSGTLTVLGVDVSADPHQIQARVGYMPQKFGLYEDLTVQENLDLYADLHGVTGDERQQRYARLFDMTALGPFTDRLAGQLSGGMKQKLGLACTLVRTPELLLLDEPTVGVDPISRRELWDILLQLVKEQGLTVLLSTSYLDEAERCDQAVVLHQGKVLAHGPPSEVTGQAAGRTFLLKPAPEQTARGLQVLLLDDTAVIDAVPEGGQVRVVAAEAGAGDFRGADIRGSTVAPRFEDGFMVLLRAATAQDAGRAGSVSDRSSQPIAGTPVADVPGSPPVVYVKDLVRKFGAFTAVNHISFEVHQGEIFGLLGPNGAGKTTTFRMLCGLLTASGGELRVAGLDLRRARASARERIGYVAQKFSLYGQLTVAENLEFFASAYSLRGDKKKASIDRAMTEFELHAFKNLPSGQLPGGYKQRLAMAAALLHQPDILFLDEPTSGADPLARRDFWRRITVLADRGVTVIVTTHFMEEAEYCDHVVILDQGQVLAKGTPAEIRRHARSGPGRTPTMEDAFISIVEEARTKDGKNGNGEPSRVGQDSDPDRPHPVRIGILTYAARLAVPRETINRISSSPRLVCKARRTWALVRKEFRQILRDPSSIAIGVVLPVMLIILFGYGLSLDVRDVPIAIVLEQPSPDAVELAAGFQLSPYFETRIMTSMQQAEKLMLARQVDGILCVKADFPRHLARGDAEVQLLVHGTDANRARIIQGYAVGAVAQWSARRVAEGRPVSAGPVAVVDRIWFNSANDSHYFLVPGLVVLVMTLIGAMLTALVVAREWERGTIEAMFVTPVTSGEILAGKTFPYFVLGMIGLALCLLAAKFVFLVPFRGSVLVLTGVSMLYLLVALGIGLLISTATKSQFVASQLTMLVTFLPAVMLSGFLFDLHSMPFAVQVVTYCLPARYYVSLLQTVFLAGDVWEVIWPNAAVLAGMAAFLVFLTRRATRKRLD